MLCHIIIHLSHRIRINLTSNDGAENVCRYEDAFLRQLIIGIRNKLRDDIRLGASPVNASQVTFFVSEVSSE